MAYISVAAMYIATLLCAVYLLVNGHSWFAIFVVIVGFVLVSSVNIDNGRKAEKSEEQP